MHVCYVCSIGLKTIANIFSWIYLGATVNQEGTFIDIGKVYYNANAVLRFLRSATVVTCSQSYSSFPRFVTGYIVQTRYLNFCVIIPADNHEVSFHTQLYI